MNNYSVISPNVKWVRGKMEAEAYMYLGTWGNLKSTAGNTGVLRNSV